jgi:chromosome partitioning protein
MSRIVAVANQKGGVGKTTTAVNLAASLAAAEHRTLLIDIDPQANASSGLGIGPQSIDKSIYAALDGTRTLGELRCRTEMAHLDLIPAGPDLYGAELALAELPDRLNLLGQGLGLLAGEYDVVLIDCPPSLGLLTLNALCAADSVLIPMQCEYYALEGLSALLQTIERVRRSLNPGLAVDGVLFCMYDPRTNLTHQVEDEVKQHLGRVVFDTVIPRNIRLSESPSHGKPILLYDKESRGCQSYLALADEFLKRSVLKEVA